MRDYTNGARLITNGAQTVAIRKNGSYCVCKEKNHSKIINTNLFIFVDNMEISGIIYNLNSS